MAVKTWEDKYEIARSYYQEHGNLLVPDKHIYGGTARRTSACLMIAKSVRQLGMELPHTFLRYSAC